MKINKKIEIIFDHKLDCWSIPLIIFWGKNKLDGDIEIGVGFLCLQVLIVIDNRSLKCI